jgi:two-component system, sporulation sensor kinase E
VEKGFAHNHETTSYKKSGQIFDSLLSGVVIELNGEKCVLGTKADITELRQYQREISRLDSLNLIGEMAAGIAHEVRNPMTTVKGFLQLLSEKQEYKQHYGIFTLMVSELDRANSIITEFLSLVKNKPVDIKPQDLNSIIENLFPLIQADATVADKYVNLELNRIETLFADGNELRQLILNLVRNGFEAMSPGGKLTIKTYMINNMVVLVVQDQGKGIDANAIDKIGTPFFTTKDNGTGLGLATCYSIVARHMASIDFDTGPSGTTFYTRFNAC